GLHVAATQYPSSIVWGQSLTQGDLPSDIAMWDGTWSWPFARDSFFRALTELEPAAREESMAKTFRALGQLPHLVQDATVPAHVRNDSHLSATVLGLHMGDTDPYEAWVEMN